MLLFLWIASLGLVLFLHAFPFTFDASLATPEAWRAFWASWGWQTHYSNAIANAALFLPLGFLGMLAAPPRNRFARALLVVAVSLATAVVAQAAQLYLPQRDATLVDTVWNMVGLAPGVLLSLVPWRIAARRSAWIPHLRTLPLLILGCWAAYRLAPWVPTLDVQTMKDNLKPLLLEPDFSAWAIYANFAAWLAAGLLLREADRGGRLDLALPLVLALTLLGQVMIVHSGGVTLPHLAGGLLAAAVWLAVLRWPGAGFAAAGVVLVLAARIAVEGLRPFTFEDEPVRPFLWLPFAGVLGGNMWLNTLVMLEKLFLYSAMTYALWVACRSWALTAALGGSFLFAIEWMQQYQPGRVAEITDPLLVVMVSMLGWALTQRERRRSRESA